ncbi:hypothetical protein RZS08_10485, partial [Arthrospira platensis SPKY1]|nr:hypothetical protein [Arthrospira platensis SPKY1]
GFLRRSGYWVHDIIFNGGLVKKQYRDIQEIVENPVLGKERTAKYLKDLLAHASVTTEFYKTYSGKPISEFPVVNKIDYRANYDSFVSTTYKGKGLHIQSTSGSTGAPFSVPQNKEKRDRVIAELKLYALYAGHKSHEKLIYLKILTSKTKKPWLTCFSENIWRLDCSSLGNNNLESIRQT